MLDSEDKETLEENKKYFGSLEKTESTMSKYSFFLIARGFNCYDRVAHWPFRITWRQDEGHSYVQASYSLLSVFVRHEGVRLW